MCEYDASCAFFIKYYHLRNPIFTNPDTTHLFISPINLQGEYEATFSYPVEAGEDVEGIITLRSPIHGVAAHDIMVCMPNAKFSF